MLLGEVKKKNSHAYGYLSIVCGQVGAEFFSESGLAPRMVSTLLAKCHWVRPDA